MKKTDEKTVISKKVLWSVGGALSVLIISSLVMILQPSVAHASNCKELQFKVGLSPSGPKNQNISGTYCQPDNWSGSERELDLLLHGATYNRDYWDWPTDYPKYSYVDKTLKAGRATLAIDMLGAGKSSTPLGVLLTTEAGANAVHEVVQKMRSEHGYKKVNSISHSLGSIVAQNEAGKYQDVDKVVLTGMTHSTGTGLVNFFASLIPASLDKKFAGLLDPSYLTTRSDTRGVFFNSNVDPKVREFDELNKDKAPAGQIPGFPKTFIPVPLNVTKNIKVPTLVVVGSQDLLFCGLTLNCSDEQQLKNTEQPYFPNAKTLTARSIPATGHNLTLHPSADESFTVISNWIKQ